MVLLIITWGHTTKQHKNFMRKLSLILLTPLLVGCDPSGGMGSFNWSPPGEPDGQTCESTAGFWQQYCGTGEHPNICDCYQ